MFDITWSLIVGYILLATVLIWDLIKTKGSYIIRVPIILMMIYYSLILFLALPNMMGWPVKEDIPPNAKVISPPLIVEPSPSNDGAIYFWINTEPNHWQDLSNLMNPKKAFVYSGSRRPRAYEIEYSEEMHRKIIEAMKKKGERGGSAMMTGKEGIKKSSRRGDGTDMDDKLPPFKILTPHEMLPKPK